MGGVGIELERNSSGAAVGGGLEALRREGEVTHAQRCLTAHRERRVEEEGADMFQLVPLPCLGAHVRSLEHGEQEVEGGREEADAGRRSLAAREHREERLQLTLLLFPWPGSSNPWTFLPGCIVDLVALACAKDTGVSANGEGRSNEDT